MTPSEHEVALHKVMAQAAAVLALLATGDTQAGLEAADGNDLAVAVGVMSMSVLQGFAEVHDLPVDADALVRSLQLATARHADAAGGGLTD